MSDPFIAPWDLQEEPVDERYGPPSPINGQQNDQIVGNGVPNGGNPFAENGSPQDKKIMFNDVINNVINELNSGVVLNEEVNNEHGTGQAGESGELKNVQPGESGEGLPYAPVDWPNPGDNWTWKVGRRIGTAGFFQDRFLYPPKHFPKVTGARPPFASKNGVTNYIRTVFPDSNIDAFFSSFSWKVPGKVETPLKAEAISTSSPKPSQDANKEVEGQGEVSRLRKRKPKSPPPPPSPPPPKQKKTRSAAKPSATKQKSNQKSSQKNVAASSSAAAKRKSRHGAKQTVAVPFADENGQGEEDILNIPIPEDFDNYLKSLEDIIAQPLSDSTSVQQSTTKESPVADEDIAEARHRLSSLLVMDFPSLVLSTNYTELPALATKLRKDPHLTAEQLVKLKLIEEIPSFREVFLESREIIDQVDRQFGTLDANKAKVASLKSEYSELKYKTDELQAQIDNNLETVREIDNEIARLQARKAELIHAAESNKAAKLEVSYAQKMVANAIPNVVHEIQNSNSKAPEWDLKRRNAVKREEEILAKFAPLQGFSLVPSAFQGLFY
ncbi:hypothetical protein LINPERHAP1_LOCUS25200 [Linum perenne]